MSVRIELGNVRSRIVAPDRGTLDTVQRYVAYREIELPPPMVQAEIKAYFRDNNRIGAFGDIRALAEDRRVRETMAEYGFDYNELTVGMLEATLSNRGTWDGWRSMVTAKGEFPTGLLEHVQRALEFRAGVRWELDDRRGPRPDPRPGWPVPALYPFQSEAVEACLSAGRGVVDLPPRSGKTRIALAIVARIGRPAIYIAPTIGIARQTVRAFAEFLPSEHVRLATGSDGKGAREARKRTNALIWVATPKTATGLAGIASRDVLIFDEFHHAAAETWQEVSGAFVNAWWRFGLTGTHFRADGRDMEMAGVLGRAVYSRSVEDMVGLGRLVPAKIAMLRLNVPAVHARSSGNEWYKRGISEHEYRHSVIAWAAWTLAERGKRVLVLTKEIDHARALAALMPGAVQVDGEDNDAVERALADLASGQRRIVVGTSVIGEGRDVPVADALVYAAGGKSPVKLTQDYYRVLTANPGKKHGIVVDIGDTHHGVLLDHAVDRLAIYRGEPAFVSEVMDPDQFPGWLATIEGV